LKAGGQVKDPNENEGPTTATAKSERATEKELIKTKGEKSEDSEGYNAVGTQKSGGVSRKPGKRKTPSGKKTTGRSPQGETSGDSTGAATLTPESSGATAESGVATPVETAGGSQRRGAWRWLPSCKQLTTPSKRSTSDSSKRKSKKEKSKKESKKSKTSKKGKRGKTPSTLFKKHMPRRKKSKKSPSRKATSTKKKDLQKPKEKKDAKTTEPSEKTAQPPPAEKAKAAGQVPITHPQTDQQERPGDQVATAKRSDAIAATAVQDQGGVQVDDHRQAIELALDSKPEGYAGAAAFRATQSHIPRRLVQLKLPLLSPSLALQGAPKLLAQMFVPLEL
ncbi:nonstructural protein, partial [Ostertagia ostertagi]